LQNHLSVFLQLMKFLDLCRKVWSSSTVFYGSEFVNSAHAIEKR